MESSTLSQEATENLNRVIEKLMEVMGATTCFWFLVYILVDLID